MTIHWDKITPGYEHNFNQHIADGDDVGAYDYGSIMHYPRDAFSIDGSDTITPTTSGVTIGQRTALSAGDIAAANTLCARRKLPKEVIETIKEMVKDIRVDTRKEMIFDTRKEMLKDRIKEVAFDPPWGTLAEQVIIPGRLPTLQPTVFPQAPSGAQPFAVATPHQAPVAGAEAEPTIAQLDAQLQMLAEQIAQVEANREMLQAQYDETAALLDQAVKAHEASRRG